MNEKTDRYSWLHWIIPPTLLAALTALVYSRSLHYEFQFDDIANITKHFDIRHNTFSMLWFSGTRWISYWLNSIHYSIGKFDPFSYRVGNVLIHTANGILVFFLLLTALSYLKKEGFFKKNAFFIATLTALLFLLHPVQTQTVSYVIQGELEGLAALFILSMSLCYLKFTQTFGTQKLLLGSLLFALAGLSCGTKEIAIISPALLVIIDWFFIAQGNWQSLKKRFFMLGSLSAMIVGIYLYLLRPSFFVAMFDLKKNNIGNVITTSPDVLISPWAFFISQFKVILHYMGIFIWPFNISVEYDWVLARGFFAPDCILPLIALLAIATGIIKLLKKNSANTVAFGALWFFACLAPRTSFIPSPELLVDYKTYLASFGLLFLLASAIVAGIEKIRAYYKNSATLKHPWHAHAACATVLAVCLSAVTVQRNTIWRSGLEFWQNIVQNAPGKARAYNNYAVELSQKLQKFAEAIPYFEKAIAMDSKYPDPCNNLAVAYSHLGKIDEAIAALKKGLAINPYYPEGYNNLASFLLQKKELDQAEQCLQIALKLRPHYGKAHFNLGRLYLEKGNQEKAWESFKNSCTKADLDTDIGFATYAKISMALEKYQDAIYGYTKTLELNPQYPDAAFNLGNAYYLTGDVQNSIKTFERLIAQNPQEVRATYNLGEAYLKIDDAQNALRCFKRLENLTSQMPQLPIRMASCYSKLGDRATAQKLLADTIQNTQAPADIRTIAQQLLNNKQNWTA